VSDGAEVCKKLGNCSRDWQRKLDRPFWRQYWGCKVAYQLVRGGSSESKSRWHVSDSGE